MKLEEQWQIFTDNCNETRLREALFAERPRAPVTATVGNCDKYRMTLTLILNVFHYDHPQRFLPRTSLYPQHAPIEVERHTQGSWN